MYVPPAYRETRADVLHALVRAHPLGTLVTAGAAGLTANLIPFALVETAGGMVLRAHLARANPQCDDLRAGAETLVIFQGPEAYVTPSWYAAKAEHGRVVPTWNYAVVQVRGRPQVFDAPDWLAAQVGRLTEGHEAGRAHPWAVSDAPEAFIAGQLRAIVGLEIPIERIEGKWKMSQNRSEADRSGVAEGLRAEGAEAAADLVVPRP
ncbi:MAG: FMN-binding negative transcriptional regulator [Pseudomonadota bacterium]